MGLGKETENITRHINSPSTDHHYPIKWGAITIPILRMRKPSPSMPARLEFPAYTN